jgi:hypothetical protein
VYANGARSRLKEAVGTAFYVLNELGQVFPRNPGWFAVQREHLKTRLRLRGMTDRFFLRLQETTDTDHIAAMQMLNFAIFYAYVVKPELGILAALRELHLVIKYGMAAPAVMAIGVYGYLL